MMDMLAVFVCKMGFKFDLCVLFADIGDMSQNPQRQPIVMSAPM